MHCVHAVAVSHSVFIVESLTLIISVYVRATLFVFTGIACDCGQAWTAASREALYHQYIQRRTDLPLDYKTLVMGTQI